LRLLTAAGQEMVEHGYAGASLSMIAARLGLTKGALGHHFPTKQDIAIGVFERADELARQSAESALSTFPDSALRACIAYFAGIARDGARDPIATASLALYQDPSVPVEVARRMFEGTRTIIDGFLRRYVDEENGSLAMPCARATLMLQMLAAGELATARFQPEYSVEEAVSLFAAALTGIGVPDADAVVADGVRAVWAS
jgi:AcrR family transcriptional regulator